MPASRRTAHRPSRSRDSSLLRGGGEIAARRDVEPVKGILPGGRLLAPEYSFKGSPMSRQAVITSLSGIALVLACGHHPAPAPAAELGRDPGCPDTVAQRDSGIALGHDVRRGPRYRVDSAGRVETLPPVPAARADTAKPGCPSFPDTSDSSARR